MDTPVLIINYKTYRKGSGEKARELSAISQKKSEETGASIVLAVQNSDIHRINDTVELPVFGQHVDSEGYGSNTGSDIVDTLKFNGAEGALINHSEDQVEPDEIKKAVKRCQEKGLTTVVCVDSVSLGEKVERFGPDFIAYEPPELIGGDVSVSKAKPEVLEKMVESVDIPVLTGAGVKTSEDVEKSLEIGAVGVLVASGIVKAEDPGIAIDNLVEPF